MTEYQVPYNEDDRIKSLKDYGILDTLPEKEYDEITFLASQICQTPMSLVSLVDTNRQWFKSHLGVDSTETSRDIAFCAHAILQPHIPFIVTDSTKDERFKNNILVTETPHIIYYAGVSLLNAEGHALGVLCVMDGKPRQLTDNQISALKILGQQVVRLMDLRKKNLQYREATDELKSTNLELKTFANVVAHDVQTPLNNILSITNLLQDEYGLKLDTTGNKLIGMLHESASNLSKLVSGILDYSRNTSISREKLEEIDINELIQQITSTVTKPESFEIRFIPGVKNLIGFRVPLIQILMNLINNAIKYNDKDKGQIEIEVTEMANFLKFRISDNGPGIAPENHQSIFLMMKTLGLLDRNHQKGTGIGLATVKRLIEKLGGEIHVISALGKGATFEFTIKNNGTDIVDNGVTANTDLKAPSIK